jgi:hypothetical protein
MAIKAADDASLIGKISSRCGVRRTALWRSVPKFESFTALNRFFGRPRSTTITSLPATQLDHLIVCNRLGVSAHLLFLYFFSSNKTHRVWWFESGGDTKK